MTDYMKQLETLMGTKHVLVDDWNTLGWEFFTIPLAQTRAVSLTNYTECKAEGGTVVFTIEEDWHLTHPDNLVLRVIDSNGSGPHGIPWWEDLVPYEGKVKINDVNLLASSLMKACNDEGESSYWDPWRDGRPCRTLLFKDRSIGETEDRLIEIPHPWDEKDFQESLTRAES